MRELEPAVNEYEQLRGVLLALEDPEASRHLNERLASSGLPLGSRALGGTSNGGPARAGGGNGVAPKRRRAKRVGTKPGADGRAPQGANKQRILAAIAEHPGITSARVAELTGLKRPVVSSTITRLKRTGELYNHGQGVCLAEIPGRPHGLSALLGEQRSATKGGPRRGSGRRASSSPLT